MSPSRCANRLHLSRAERKEVEKTGRSKKSLRFESFCAGDFACGRLVHAYCVGPTGRHTICGIENEPGDAANSIPWLMIDQSVRPNRRLLAVVPLGLLWNGNDGNCWNLLR